MTLVLRLACLHCCLWGLFIIALPEISARVYGFDKPLTDIFLWKGTGLIIFLFGIGYGIASTNPRQHWAIVTMGLVAKILGPIGLCWAAFQGEVPVTVLYLLPVNDIVWWWPFAIIVRRGISPLPSRQNSLLDLEQRTLSLQDTPG